MSNSWSLLGLCGPRSRKQFGNAAFLIVLLHNSHRHITAEMLSTTFPQEITHKRVLKDCDEEFKVFLTAMEALDEKRRPLLFQFGKFDKYEFNSLNDSLARVTSYLEAPFVLFEYLSLVYFGSCSCWAAWSCWRCPRRCWSRPWPLPSRADCPTSGFCCFTSASASRAALPLAERTAACVSRLIFGISPATFWPSGEP